MVDDEQQPKKVGGESILFSLFAVAMCGHLRAAEARELTREQVEGERVIKWALGGSDGFALVL